MCGRFALNVSESSLKAHFHLTSGLVLHPRYNISPNSSIPIIKTWENGIDFARWGFVPSWHKEPPTAATRGHINARGESLLEKPTFKTAFQKQRCLIPATGYFEWKHFGEKKQPYYVYLKNQPMMAFAGIWSSWDTCAIITMEAPAFLQKLHERVPAIIAPDHYAAWLHQGVIADPSHCWLSLTEDSVGVYAVTPRMNNPQFEDPLCIAPLSALR